MTIEKNKNTSVHLSTTDFEALPCLPWSWQTGLGAHLAWADGVRAIENWLLQQGVSPRDAVVVLPQSSHLSLASKAWARECTGWMPRFETVNTLRERLPSFPDEKADITASDALVLNQSIDALLITVQLKQTLLGRKWAKQFPDYFSLAVEHVMALTHDWLRVCLSLPPEERDAYVSKAQVWLSTHGLPENMSETTLLDDIAGRERWLADHALALALQSWPYLIHQNQPLFDHRPEAWLLITVGKAIVPGTEAALMCHVLKHAQKQGISVCWMPICWSGKSSEHEVENTSPSLTPSRNFDHEAMAATAWVIQLINERRLSCRQEPVALITHDRALSRRIRALLMTHEVASQLQIADESGWVLSTTRAAAAVTRLLAAANPQADADDVMDWLQHGWIAHGHGDQAVDCLAQHWRQQKVQKPWLQLSDLKLVQESTQERFWLWAKQVLLPLQELATKEHTLVDSLEILKKALQSCGAWLALLADEAGLVVLKALHLNMPSAYDPLETSWLLLACAQRQDLQSFSQWVHQNLSRENYVPLPSLDDADVVFTPLNKAVLRPFSGIVFPGVDNGQLGVSLPAGHLLGMLEMGLGLSSPQIRAEAQWEAFALLAAQPHLKAVYRQNRDGGPCGPSDWLGRWWWINQSNSFARNILPFHWPLATDPCVMLEVPLNEQSLPRPALMDESIVAEVDALWPTRLSASAYQRLRDCPYRYFALDILKLKTTKEMEDVLEPHEYGTWLHAVLKRYHEQEKKEQHSTEVSSESFIENALKQWLAVADQIAQEMGFLEGIKRASYFLYRINLPALAMKYLRWQMIQQNAGWQWRHLEKSFSLVLPLPQTRAVRQVVLYGELDRIDAINSDRWCVIDYKTGSISKLKAQVKQPQEDTQMAFYALLLQSTHIHQDVQIEAIYLRLHQDDVEKLVHDNVQETAASMADAIVSDMTRIYQGHAMPALGQGGVCDHCEVRGLCRKDHWTKNTDSSFFARVQP